MVCDSPPLLNGTDRIRDLVSAAKLEGDLNLKSKVDF